MQVRIAPIDDADDADWLSLRMALWPDASAAEHRTEMLSLTAQPERYAQFMARSEAGIALGLAEAAVRHDDVPGTDTSSVAFLEGLFVEPRARGQGVARALVGAVEHWPPTHRSTTP
jgi:aminoglycoside 6'-N-acetyltransferase I